MLAALCIGLVSFPSCAPCANKRNLHGAGLGGGEEGE